jgi:hypothetical protein
MTNEENDDNKTTHQVYITQLWLVQMIFPWQMMIPRLVHKRGHTRDD